MNPLTLGSLFSGSGGFELAGKLCGIQPVWASEIEPFPIRVTTKRLPAVRHLGDIRQIDGAKIPPVDVITMGSPCTNLSTANAKREGLAGKQSSLFFEAIRIIKEMRKETNGTYPRFIVWENVPGAFSSNNREDFKQVLEEIINIAAPGAKVPAPDKNGWSYADIFVGDGWSLAYRTIDAQYFGVAQRRKRIYLICDFAGECAGDILFERQGVRRDFAQGFRTWQTPAGTAADSLNPAIVFEPGVLKRLGRNVSEELSPTLRASVNDNCPPAVCLAGNIVGRKAENGGNGTGFNAELSFTLNTADRHAVSYVMTAGSHIRVSNRQAPTLQARDWKDPPLINQDYIARRLVPQECALLQGFPDWWCSGLETPEPTEKDISFWAKVFEEHRLAMGKSKRPKSRGQIVKWLSNPHSDSAEWKMWGNGIALPCALFVLGGIAELVQEEG